MAEVKRRPQAGERGARMLRTALGPVIARALEDPVTPELMLNPDGRLWTDRMGAPQTGATARVVELPAISRLLP